MGDVVVKCIPTDGSLVVVMVLVDISKFRISWNIERNPIQVQPSGNVHLMLLKRWFHKFYHGNGCWTVVFSLFFATSYWIEGLAGISSEWILLMCFFRFSCSLLFTKKSHAWASLGLPYKMRKHVILIFSFVIVPEFSGVFNFQYILWTQCRPLLWQCDISSDIL